jgi:hypothetical protein
MDTSYRSPFRARINRDDYAALALISRGNDLAPADCQRLIDLGLITKSTGSYRLTTKGSLLLACGPT